MPPLPRDDLWGVLAFAMAIGLAAWKGKRGMAWACLFGFAYPVAVAAMYFVKGWIRAGHIVGLREADAGIYEAAIVWPILGAFMGATGLIAAFGGGVVGLMLRPIILRRISG